VDDTTKNLLKSGIAEMHSLVSQLVARPEFAGRSIYESGVMTKLATLAVKKLAATFGGKTLPVAQIEQAYLEKYPQR
jgi:hypothetical protein